MKNNLYTANIETPLGNMKACATEEGICMLGFADQESLAISMDRLCTYYDSIPKADYNYRLKELESQLGMYFDGQLKSFTVPLVLHGTEFQGKVWQQLNKIPYGKSISYGTLAQDMQKPQSTRAIARIIGQNMILIAIPCHRVVGANGSLTGYAGGLWRKQTLLNLEKEEKDLFSPNIINK